MSGRVNTKRTYDNSRRAEEAARTRRRVLAAGHDLFLDQGYAATTIAQIAAQAGVSAVTVQKAFGTKGQLVKAVYDVTLAGDDAPIPLRERPEMQALVAEPDPVRKLERYAAIGRSLWERLGPLLGIVLSGAGAGEPDLVELLATVRQESMTGARGVVGLLAADGALRPGLSMDEGAELLWWLIQPEQYHLLVTVHGWSLDRLELWLSTTAAALLLP